MSSPIRVVVAGLLLAGVAVGASAQDIYLDAVNGDDLTGDGSPAAPWRSLSRAAVRCPGPGSPPLVRYHLAPGTYDEASGEVFPVRLCGEVSLLGAGAGSTRITSSGPATPALVFIDEQTTWLANAWVTGVDFDGQARAAIGLGVSIGEFGQDRVTVRDCRFRDFRDVGLAAYAAETGFPGASQGLDVGRCQFDRNRIGLRCISQSDPLDSVLHCHVANSVFRWNQTGILLRTQSGGDPLAVSIVDGNLAYNSFLGQTGTAIVLENMSLVSQPAIAGNIFAGSGGYGIDNTYFTPLPPPTPSPLTLSANLFWGNALGDYHDAQLGDFPTAADVNRLPFADPSCPNLDGDPAFADPVLGDLHLTAPSAALDRGCNANAPADDFEGQGRPADGDGDGVAIADIGADEAGRLRRATLARLVPRMPDLGQVYPFGASNPLTPSIREFFASGQGDPDFGILSRASVPLALYQTDPPGPFQLRLVKDLAADSVLITLAP